MVIMDKHYDRKAADSQRRIDNQYDKLAELEDKLDELMTQLKDLKQQNISGDSIFRFLLHFDELYNKFSDIEKRNFMRSFIDYIDLYPEKQADGKWIRNIVSTFRFLYSEKTRRKFPWKMK